jgi:hypothetical protein
MVVLMSATRIDIHARGTGARFRYGEGTDGLDYDFSISADGGVCTTGTFTAPIVTRKYPASGSAIVAGFGTTYDQAPLGGFGGMGIVQLMAPAGTNATDGTNTRLDDNINVFKGGNLQSGTAKRDLLGWRGFPNQLGQGVDDNGTLIPQYTPPPATNLDNEGDIRPAPTLLPAPFTTTSRLRSRWIDTGASKRRPIAGDDNLPRGIIDPAQTLFGPRYEFAGVSPATGYANYLLQGTLATTTFPTIVDATPIFSSNPNVSHLGKPAYRVELSQPAMGTTVDRYTQYEAEVLDGADIQVGAFRILTHTDRELVLATESGPFPANAAKVRVRAKFFDIVTAGATGFGPTYLGSGGQRVPIANVRIGFAFHQDPASPTAQRFPANPNEYAYNLSDPAVQEQVRLLHAPFVQWDVLFDTAFKAAPADAPPALSPDTPRPELRFLRLPYRF